MCEVAITLRADLDTISCMKGKISAAKTGTSHSIKNGEYLTGRYVGNGKMGYAYQCITYYVVVSYSNTLLVPVAHTVGSVVPILAFGC